MSKILLDTGPSKYSLSRVATFLRCPQLYAWKYVVDHGAGVKFPPSDALMRGSLVHVGQAHLNAQWRAMQRGQNPDAYYEPLEAMEVAARELGSGGARWEEGTKRLLGICQNAMAEYMANFPTPPRDEVELVEDPIDFWLTDPQNGKKYHYQRKPDVVRRLYATGKRLMVDHKTLYRISTEKLRRYALDLSFLCYRWLGQELVRQGVWKEGFDGIIIHAIGMDAHQFKMLGVEPTPDAVRHFESIVIQAEREIERNLREYPDPRDWFRWRKSSEYTCFTPYGPCDGFELCAWGLDARRQEVEQDARKVDFNFSAYGDISALLPKKKNSVLPVIK